MTDTVVNDGTSFVVEEMESIMKCIPFAIQLPSDILFNEIDHRNNDDDDKNDPNLDRKTSNVTTTTKKQSKQKNILWDKYNSYGIVGTILYIGPNSVLIWFGWGEINSNNNNNNNDSNTTTTNTDTNHNIPYINTNSINVNNNEISNNNVQETLSSSKIISVGQSKDQSMGPLAIGMPPMKYSTNTTSSRGSGISSKLIGNENPVIEMIIEQMSVRLSSKLSNVSLLITCSPTLIDDTPRVAAEGMDTESIVYRAVALTENEIYRLLK